MNVRFSFAKIQCKNLLIKFFFYKLLRNVIYASCTINVLGQFSVLVSLSDVKENKKQNYG